MCVCDKKFAYSLLIFAYTIFFRPYSSFPYMHFVYNYQMQKFCVFFVLLLFAKHQRIMFHFCCVSNATISLRFSHHTWLHVWFVNIFQFWPLFTFSLFIIRCLLFCVTQCMPGSLFVPEIWDEKSTGNTRNILSGFFSALERWTGKKFRWKWLFLLNYCSSFKKTVSRRFISV